MTKFLLQILAISLAFSLNSQNLNVAEHENLDITGGVVNINSKYYYLKTSKGPCCDYSLSLTGTDEYSQNIFRTFVGNKHVKHLGKLIVSQDKALVFSGFDQLSCDQTQSWEYLVKIDTNGAVIFKTVLFSWGSWSPQIVGVTQHPDGSFYAIAGNILFHCLPAGQLAPSFTLSSNIGSVTTIQALANGNLLLNGTLSGVRKNILMSTSGTILNSQPASGGVAKYYERNNGYYALRSVGVLERYDSNLILKANSTINLSATSYTISDFKVRSDSLYVTGVTGLLRHPFYAVLDSSFSVLHMSVLNYEGLWPTGIAINNNKKVHIVSTCCSRPITEFSFSGIFCLDQTGYVMPSLDIGVTGYSVISADFYDPFYTTPRLNLNVRVKNFGTDTVRSFFVNYYANMISCYPMLHKRVDTLLAPGNSLNLETGIFYGLENYTSQIKNNKWNICVFTTIPNDQNDVNINNDGYCDTLQLLTSIREIKQGRAFLQVFPNPSSGPIHFQAETEIQEILILDAAGVILALEKPRSKEFKLELSLKPGFYLAKIYDGKTTTVKKIIRE